MDWYLTKLVYRIICGNGEHMAQFDEQLRLIYAEDEMHAFNKAQIIGEKEQQLFRNTKQQLVNWKFINVTELHKLDNFTDGAEIFSQIRETVDGNHYQHMVQAKSRTLSEYCTEQFIQSL